MHIEDDILKIKRDFYLDRGVNVQIIESKKARAFVITKHFCRDAQSRALNMAGVD